ncbi:MAG TPA: zeta toxin family protein [Parafilimonas sp.]|nr:zeta toxin family protein [Parafilimonas sp.]
MPELYIITGSNGAGKSTIGPFYLPEHIRLQNTVFDGDKLFMQKQGELWRSGIRAHKEARKLAFEFVENTFNSLVETALNNNTDFVYEGHFTNDTTWDIPKRFKANGYVIHLIFLGLANTALSELRVLARTKEGGHYVDPFTIADNFYGNLEKLNLYYRIFDSVNVINTSEIEHILLATFNNGVVQYAVPATELPEWFIRNMPNMAAQIK